MHISSKFENEIDGNCVDVNYNKDHEVNTVGKKKWVDIEDEVTIVKDTKPESYQSWRRRDVFGNL